MRRSNGFVSRVGAGMRPADGRRVAVTTVLALIAGLLVLAPAEPAQAAVDGQPLVVALCHGANQTWPENFDLEHFEAMFTETAGSETVADYWRDISHGQFSIDGTLVLDVQLPIPRDDFGDRDQSDFAKCRDGVNEQYNIDWNKYAGPVVIKPRTEGRTVNAIDTDDTTLQVRAEGPSVMDDWSEPPFTLVLTKTGSLWRDRDTNVENVLVTAVHKDPVTNIATFTIKREQKGYRQHDAGDVAPPAKPWPVDTIVKDISDTYGSKNRTAVVSADADPSVINQELGHFFGFDHSRKLSTADNGYGDCFDVMSTLTCTSHYFQVPFGYPGGTLDQWNGPGMTSAFLDLKGWIAASDRATFDPTGCSQQSYSMRALGLEGTGLHQIRVPVEVDIRDGVKSEYLTVELRSQQFVWDQGIPSDAFVLHLKGDDDLAYLVDDSDAGGTSGMSLGDYYVFDVGTEDSSDDRFFYVNEIDKQNGTGQITLATCPFTSDLTYTGSTSFTYSTSPEVTATFELKTGAAAPGGEVMFALEGSTCSDRIFVADQEDGTGEAMCKLAMDMMPGTYDLTARWDGIEGVFEPAQKSVQVTVEKRATSLRLDPPGAVIYHDPVALRATLEKMPHSDDTGILTIQGADVELSIGADAAAQSCTDTTNYYGVARCKIDSVDQTPGAVSVDAAFAGDDYYLPSTATDSLTVDRRATVLTVDAPDFAASDGKVTLTGTLVEDATTKTAGGTPIKGRTVTLTLGEGSEAQDCTGSTDSSGVASCEIDVYQQLGVQAISAAFAGDDYYLSSSDDDELIIFEWTDGGHFVVGDASAVIDTTVTFWSSEWYLENMVSGGLAPDAFKGFANTPAGPTDCGTTAWTSFGGNKADVATEVPVYTAMLVTDSVAKRGGNVAGSTVAIAIVRVDPPGTQPAPGHTSTATVLGFLCGP